MSKLREFWGKVSQWLSVSRILHHDRLMMILSLVLAVTIWYSVISGPAYIVDRSIEVDVIVELGENSYLAKNGLRIVGNNEFTVKVNVEGRWSEVSKLRDTDFRVRVDTNSITGEGDINLPVNATNNSMLANYDIISVSPPTVPITCAYWQEGATFSITVDTSGLTAEEGKIIGEPSLDLESAFVTVDGPKNVVSKIDKVVAKVVDNKPLSGDVKTYSTELSGVDSAGKTLDLSECTFREFPEGKVDVSVPLWVQTQIEVQFETKNQPSGLDFSEYVIVEPHIIDVKGPAADVNAFAEQLAAVGEIDFSKLSLGKTEDGAASQMEFPLKPPANVIIANNISAVTISLDSEKLAEKTVTLTATKDNVKLAEGSRATIAEVGENQHYEVVLVGDKDSIARIGARDLRLVLENDVNATRMSTYTASIRIEGYDDVWVCYGNYPNGFPVKATLQ